MSELKIVYGDATAPQGDGEKYIIHICNSVGAFGAGFVLALSNKWPQTRKVYKGCFEKKMLHNLGCVQPIVVEDDITVWNMIAQKGINNSQKADLVDYNALTKCLDQVFSNANDEKASIHAPRIGSALAGGDWLKIEDMLLQRVEKYNVDCIIYILRGRL